MSITDVQKRDDMGESRAFVNALTMVAIDAKVRMTYVKEFTYSTNANEERLYVHKSPMLSDGSMELNLQAAREVYQSDGYEGLLAYVKSISAFIDNPPSPSIRTGYAGGITVSHSTAYVTSSSGTFRIRSK